VSNVPQTGKYGHFSTSLTLPSQLHLITNISSGYMTMSLSYKLNIYSRVWNPVGYMGLVGNWNCSFK